jgi:hypothetical protein
MQIVFLLLHQQQDHQLQQLQVGIVITLGLEAGA